MDRFARDDGFDAFFGYLGRTMNLGPIRQFFATLEERKGHDEPFPVPLVHLYARKDPMVPARFGPILAEKTGAPLVWIEDASHFMHVDAVERFLPPALDFLASSSPAR